MKNTDLRYRIAAILLAVMVAVPATGFSASDAYATDEESVQTEEQVQTEESAHNEDSAQTEETAQNKEGAQAEEKAASEEQSQNGEGSGSVKEEPAADSAKTDTDAPAGAASEKKKAAALSSAAQVATISIKTAGEDGNITALWKSVQSADYYLVTLDNKEQGIRVNAGSTLKAVLSAGAGKHSVRVRAYKAASVPEGQDAESQDEPAADVLVGEGVAANVSSVSRNRITTSWLQGANIGINLRTLLGENHDGYSVCQGSCTDGVYAYYLLVSSSNQKGRILKTYAGTGSVVAKSGVINVCHGNGMAFDTKRNRLVVVGRESRRNQLTVIDASSLSYPWGVSYSNVDYSYNGPWKSSASNGLAAISYVAKYDCFVALQRSSHEILVLDPDFKVIGKVGTSISSAYPGTYQAMDADERYVYLLLSAYTENTSRQPYNLILALDWNSENLLAIDETTKFIANRWMCNNNGSGTPDTVMRVSTPYEAESLYHIDMGNGTSRVYLAEYFNNPVYKTTTQQVAYKVKWKKVKKKVKVKWKKVKTKSGKKKWKYKYKWKKVWKYKTKYRTEQVKKLDHYNRDNYLYYLGVF